MAKLNVGDMAPDFTATTDSGETLRLSDLRGKRVVIFFYPKDNSLGCTTQACGFRDQYPVIEEKNAVVLGVSGDNAQSHRKFKSKHNLPYTLLVDEDHAVAQAYGVWVEKNMLGIKLNLIERSHFVIDEVGRIVDAQVNVSPTKSAQSALEALNTVSAVRI